ncbi:hypothetical protein ACIQMP_25990 [Streptomyces sp. NPDC091385]|uniref:hypothetical protein n=1 Tax=Streptomyces sp. NPDC091385 TaxID=3365997 RepID=UPI0038121E0D
MQDGAAGITRLLSRFRVVLALCVLLVGLILATLSNGREGFWWAVLNELALFAAAAVAVPFYYDLFLRDAERHRFLAEMTEVIDARLAASGGGAHGLTVHAQGRPSPVEKAHFIAGAQREIIEVGVTLRSLAGLYVSRPAPDFTAPVRRLLAQGVHITYIVADPASPLFTAYAESVGDPAMPDRAAEAARQLLRVAQGFAAEGHPGRMAVHLTRQLPTSYVSLVDPDSETGYCRTAHYLPGVRRADMPVLDITRAAQPELFERYVTYARRALAESVTLDSVQPDVV